MSSGSTPPGSTIEAACNAAKRALSFTPLKLGAIVRDRDADAHSLPGDDPRIASVTLSGLVEGTIQVAIGDEYLERLEYTSKTEGLLPALKGTFDAVLAALHPLGEFGVGEIVEAELEAWPGANGEVVVFSAPLTDHDEVVAEVSFALIHNAVVQGENREDDRPPRLAAPAGGASGSPQATPITMADTGAAMTGATLDEATAREIARLADVEVELRAVLGRTTLPLHELLGWLPGSIVTLDRVAGTPADLCVGETVVACGDVVVVEENFGVRVTEVSMRGPSAPSLGLSRP